jgi:hypothetical protein
LNILDCSQLISVVLVATEGVKVHLFAEAFVLSLDNLEDVGDLLTVVDLLVIDSYNRVENGPHDLRIVNSSKMITNIQTEDDLVQLGFLDSDTLVTQRRWKLSEEVQSNG